MTETTNASVDVCDNRSTHIMLTVWSKSGAVFQQTFSTESTFAHVKQLAMQSLLNNNQSTSSLKCHHSGSNISLDHYKLISINSRKIIDDQQTLSQSNVDHGDAYLLVPYLNEETSKANQTSTADIVDQNMINQRTKVLPPPKEPYGRLRFPLSKSDFRTNLHSILLTLIETSQKLLWCHSNAEQIFGDVQDILMNQYKTEADGMEINRNLISELIEMGFTERQAISALQRTKLDITAAVNLLLSGENVTDDFEETKTPIKVPVLYSSEGTLIPYRQFRRQYISTNSTVVRTLKDMGFKEDAILNALQICHNDQVLTCEYLIADNERKKAITDLLNSNDIDADSIVSRAILSDSAVQKALNNPKIFYLMIQLYENPSSLSTYLHDPDLGNFLLRISRIYHSERTGANTHNSSN